MIVVPERFGWNASFPAPLAQLPAWQVNRFFYLLDIEAQAQDWRSKNQHAQATRQQNAHGARGQAVGMDAIPWASDEDRLAAEAR